MNKVKARIIAKGAEATITDTGNSILKKRDKKRYRISQIDTQLRLRRTRKEVKSLQKARSLGLDIPSVISYDEHEMEIVLEKIPGKKIRDTLSAKNASKLCAIIGKDIAKLHENRIIHGDLTTSNMILNSKNNKIYIIDFGLSFESEKTEDMAVDLHLFKRALQSKHQEIWEKSWNAFIKSYMKNFANTANASKKAEIMKKLEEVELRGRNKHG